LATRLLVLTQFFSFPVVRIADEHLRQNGVGTSETSADAILPKTSEVFCQDIFHSASLI